MKDSKKQRIGTIVIIIGVILVFGAVALFAYNEYLDYGAGQKSQDVVFEMDKMRQAAADGEKVFVGADIPEEEVVPEMDVVSIDGHDYIGTIVVPDLGIELPVMASWSGNIDDLKISPVRYSGSIFTDDMVIAGHNYRSHFNPLHNASVGMEVIFVDVYGNSIVYEIVEFETIEPTKITDMVVSDADLTLFTCTYGGQARYAVRCERK